MRQGFSLGVTAEQRRLKAYRISLMLREEADTSFGSTERMLLFDPADVAALTWRDTEAVPSAPIGP